MAFLNITQGYQAIVDDEDLPRLIKHRWQANIKGKNVYAVRHQRLAPCRYRSRYLHYDVLKLPQPLPHPLCIDHINRNSLDCRKSNLRVCSRAQNARNTSPSPRKKTSKYKGVSYRPERKKWETKICANYKTYYLGYFKNEYHAMHAYNRAALEHHGRFAYLNQWTGPTHKNKDDKKRNPDLSPSQKTYQTQLLLPFKRDTVEKK